MAILILHYVETTHCWNLCDPFSNRKFEVTGESFNLLLGKSDMRTGTKCSCLRVKYNGMILCYFMRRELTNDLKTASTSANFNIFLNI
jgi:hypothetical protein